MIHFFSILQLIVETFEHSTKLTNKLKFNIVVDPTNKKPYHKTLGTSVVFCSVWFLCLFALHHYFLYLKILDYVLKFFMNDLKISNTITHTFFLGKRNYVKNSEKR